MDINGEQINRLLIPRRALAKRVGILWIFEIAACLCGFGLFAIFSLFCVIEAIWLTVRFHALWSLYYHPATLYIVLMLLIIPSIAIGLGVRQLILMIPSLIF